LSADDVLGILSPFSFLPFVGVDPTRREQRTKSRWEQRDGELSVFFQTFGVLEFAWAVPLGVSRPR